MEDLIEAFFNKPKKTYKELWEEENRKRLELGAFPVPFEYCSVTHMPIETVKATPERFIIPECLPACRELWEKGIDTFMVSDFLSQQQNNSTWIELEENKLSPENLWIVKSFEGRKGVKLWEYHKGCINIEVPFLGQEAQDALLDLARELKQQ